MFDPLPLELPVVKRCCICKAVKPLTEFNRHRARRDGLQPHCRECNRARSRRYYAENREKHLIVIKERRDRVRAENRLKMLELLRGRACADCGETDVLVLEFDHLRDKEANVGTMLHRLTRWDRILAEIAKCDVVCANCHRRRTHRRQGSYRLGLS